MIVIYTAVQNIFYCTHIMYYQFWARYRIPNIIIVPILIVIGLIVTE